MRAHRTRWIASGVVTVGLVAAVMVATVWLGPDGGSAAAARTGASTATATSTATVERRDLVERESVDGTLGYGDASDVGSPRAGTVTALPALGTVISLGQSLFEIDGRGVPLFYGARPMWRTLQAGVDDGPDVAQLEADLVWLGYANANTVHVDDHFDSATTAAVKRWQKALGVTETGVVTPQDLVFEPGPVRVAEQKGHVGSQAGPGGPLLSVTGTTRRVAVRLDAAQQSLVKVGDKVLVTLPSGTDTPGTITSVGTVATTDSSNNNSGSSTPEVDLTVTLDDAKAGGNLDGAPVTVKITQSTAKQALVVPVRSLLALAEGGYAVEVVDPASHHLVSVQLGAFADGDVAVTGDLQPGQRVVVASS
jgi:peptidoglycan hydrolase-like protein with peptidoglycan-binding domain